jgi:hypothetical protein
MYKYNYIREGIFDNMALKLNLNSIASIYGINGKKFSSNVQKPTLAKIEKSDRKGALLKLGVHSEDLWVRGTHEAFGDKYARKRILWALKKNFPNFVGGKFVSQNGHFFFRPLTGVEQKAAADKAAKSSGLSDVNSLAQSILDSL